MKWLNWFRNKKSVQQSTSTISVNHEREWFDTQTDAIRRGERQHPAMMTANERHRETARATRELDWSKGVCNSHGVLAAFEGIQNAACPQGSVIDPIACLTADEREELRAIIQKEVKLVLVAEADKPGEPA